jgi:hypothetical protein
MKPTSQILLGSSFPEPVFNFISVCIQFTFTAAFGSAHWLTTPFASSERFLGPLAD